MKTSTTKTKTAKRTKREDERPAFPPGAWRLGPGWKRLAVFTPGEQDTAARAVANVVAATVAGDFARAREWIVLCELLATGEWPAADAE